jgi:hypothetical protein
MLARIQDMGINVINDLEIDTIRQALEEDK